MCAFSSPEYLRKLPRARRRDSIGREKVWVIFRGNGEGMVLFRTQNLLRILPVFHYTPSMERDLYYRKIMFFLFTVTLKFT